MTNSIGEIEEAPCIIVIGSNTTEAHPVIGYALKRAARNGATLIVIDPRKIGLVHHATRWLSLKVGTDVALLNGIMHHIISRGLHKREFIDSHTVGFEEMERTVMRYPPEKASGITGVPAEAIKEVAEILAGAERVSLIYTLGITEHSCGVDNVKSCVNLQLLLGNIGKPSSGVNPLRGQNNVQGACDMGALPGVFSGYQRVDDPDARRKFGEAWKVSLPDSPGLTIPKMFTAMKEGKVKALYCVGENLVMSEPHQAHTIASLESLDLMIVQDIFFNETAHYADLVLPACCFAEDDGTYTNTERRVQRVHKAVEPPGAARPDWAIFADLSRRMGYDMGYRTVDDVWDDVTRLTPSYQGIQYGRIEERGIQWPCPDCEHPGTQYLHDGGDCACGLARFTAVDWRGPAEQPDESWPLVLTTGRRLWHYHTGTQTRHSDGFEQVCPEELIEINPEDADRMGIKDGEYVDVSSRRGKVTMKARITDRSPAGTVYTSFHFREACGNVLTIDAFDPVTDTAEYKACAVRIDRRGSKGEVDRQC